MTLLEQVEQLHYPKRCKNPKTDKERTENSLAEKISKQWSKLDDATRAELARLQKGTTNCMKRCFAGAAEQPAGSIASTAAEQSSSAAQPAKHAGTELHGKGQLRRGFQLRRMPISPGPKLAGPNFARFNFAGCQLRQDQLRGCQLRRAQLRRAQLRRDGNYKEYRTAKAG